MRTERLVVDVLGTAPAVERFDSVTDVRYGDKGLLVWNESDVAEWNRPSTRRTISSIERGGVVIFDARIPMPPSVPTGLQFGRPRRAVAFEE